MPTIDTELVQPLTAVADILLKRPGVVTMNSIKKLSEKYGFTTFVEHMKSDSSKEQNNSDNGVIVRLSISGLVLLIDVDFLMPMSPDDAQKMVSSPSMMNLASPSSIVGLDSMGREPAIPELTGDAIKGVYISSAITADPIEGKSYDFLFGFGGSKSCAEILYSNLKEKTLDSFNINLRLLLSFDRLSKEKPNDLFSTFSLLVYGLEKQQEIEKAKIVKDEDIDETELLKYNCGISGPGKIFANHEGKVGVFLQYWIDNWEINEWIRKNKGLTVEDTRYFLHFKVNENLKEGSTGSGTDSTHDVNSDTTTTGNFSKDSQGDIKMSNGDSERVTFLDVIDTEGNWNLPPMQKINFDNIILECCPPVWVPRNVISELSVECDIINPDNANWSDNYGTSDNREALYEYNSLVNRIYTQLNDTEASFGCVNIVENREHTRGEEPTEDNPETEHSREIRVELQTGCPMVRVFKLRVDSPNKIATVVRMLRTWAQSACVLRQMATPAAQVVPIAPSYATGAVLDTPIELGDVFGAVPDASASHKETLAAAVTENGVRISGA